MIDSLKPWLSGWLYSFTVMTDDSGIIGVESGGTFTKEAEYTYIIDRYAAL